MDEKSTPKRQDEPVSADEIAEMAERGEDVSRFFTNDGKLMPPIETRGTDGKED